MITIRRPSLPGRHDPRWALFGVTVTSLALNVWGLWLNGLGNQYYTAAARSMTRSWRNFFFAAFDQAGFISVDKPPLALWIEATSARVFGVNTWSLLLPSAVAGAGAVALLWCTIRRRFGTTAATVAAAVLALSPINVAVDRLNLPEPFLILLLVAAAWAVLRGIEAGGSAVDDPSAPAGRWAGHPLRWMALAGFFVGLAFNTKMFVAFIAVPAMLVALFVGTAGWRRRIGRALVFGATSLAVSMSWMVAVDLVPASSRPYVGGSTNDTVWNLIVGYNGFGRITGGSTGGVGGGAGAMGGSMSGAGGVFGGVAGPFRLLSEAVGPQIAWLLPLAGFCAVAAAWRHRRDRSRLAAVLLWSGWLALFAVIFSRAEGTFHSYYTSVMTPAIGALVGVGVAALIPLMRRHRAWLVATVIAGVATASLQLTMSGRQVGFYGWTRLVLVAVAVVALSMIAVGALHRRGRQILAGLAVGLTALLITPAAWASSETSNAVMNSTLPQAGPRSGVAASTFGSVSSNGDASLAAYLKSVNHGETWDVVVANAQEASGLIADDDVTVMALGGFMGTDSATSLSAFANLVADGEVRYVLVSSSGGSGGGGGMGAMSSGTGSGILSAVQSTCTAVTTASSGGKLPSSYSGRLYDCSGHATALAAAATSS